MSPHNWIHLPCQGILVDDLQLRRVESCLPEFPFRSSPLGFVPKPNNGLRRIHHLSHTQLTSTNARIEPEFGFLRYSQISEVWNHIVAAGRGSFIMKNDWEAAFRNIPIAPQDRWMMGFQWEGKFYKECCLPFGLRTAPFLFNLFAEALHWILQSWLGWEYTCHLLDDIVLVTPHSQRYQLRDRVHDFVRLTNFLGIPRNDGKFELGQVVTVFGYELDTRALPCASHLRRWKRYKLRQTLC